jgi:hypothetical protein
VSLTDELQSQLCISQLFSTGSQKHKSVGEDMSELEKGWSEGKSNRILVADAGRRPCTEGPLLSVITRNEFRWV